MSDLNNPTQPPPKSNWRPIALTITWALFLGAGSCFGANSAGGNTLTLVFSAVFILCVVVLVGALFWALGTWFQSFRRGG
jgi:hypothetical protein